MLVFVVFLVVVVVPRLLAVAFLAVVVEAERAEVLRVFVVVSFSETTPSLLAIPFRVAVRGVAFVVRLPASPAVTRRETEVAFFSVL